MNREDFLSHKFNFDKDGKLRAQVWEEMKPLREAVEYRAKIRYEKKEQLRRFDADDKQIHSMFNKSNFTK